MTKIKVSENGKSADVFTGGYVREIADVCIASAVTGQHSMIIGLPGWGKTSVSRDVLNRVTETKYSFVRLDPTTPVEKIMGPYNPAALLRDNPALERMIEGTPYDPTIRGCILDEIGRANEVVFDALLDVLDRQDVDDGAFCIGTSNFVPDGERVDALIDRFTLYVHLRKQELDIEAVANAHMTGARPSVPFDLPTWATIEKARAAQPGPKARAAVIAFIADLIDAAVAQEFMPNPRRIAQWSGLIYRLGVLYTGQEDFEEVPIEAARIMKYAWPNRDEAEAARWEEVVAEIIDTIGAAIEELEARAVLKFQEVAAMSDVDRAGYLIELGEYLTMQQEQLRKLGTGTRIDKACHNLAEWYSKACQGIDPLAKR